MTFIVALSLCSFSSSGKIDDGSDENRACLDEIVLNDIVYS